MKYNYLVFVLFAFTLTNPLRIKINTLLPHLNSFKDLDGTLSHLDMEAAALIKAVHISKADTDAVVALNDELVNYLKRMPLYSSARRQSGFIVSIVSNFCQLTKNIQQSKNPVCYSLYTINEGCESGHYVGADKPYSADRMSCCETAR